MPFCHILGYPAIVFLSILVIALNRHLFRYNGWSGFYKGIDIGWEQESTSYQLVHGSKSLMRILTATILELPRCALSLKSPHILRS